jgi:predicted DNA-binding transcriptional regulator YafY
VAKGSVWYLVADTDAGMRTFRVWRVRSVELTGEPARRPPDFDLATTWRGVVAEMDERRTSFRVQALAEPPTVGRMRAHFGTRLSVGPPAGDGRLELVVGFGATHDAAIELAGYAAGLEVVDPPEVRAALAAIGSQLVERYVAGPPARRARSR